MLPGESGAMRSVSRPVVGDAEKVVEVRHYAASRRASHARPTWSTTSATVSRPFARTNRLRPSVCTASRHAAAIRPPSPHHADRSARRRPGRLVPSVGRRRGSRRALVRLHASEQPEDAIDIVCEAGSAGRALGVVHVTFVAGERRRQLEGDRRRSCNVNSGTGCATR